MKKKIFGAIATVGLLGCSLFVSTGTASASVAGALILAGPTGGVTVTATTLTWNGTASTAAGTTLKYDGGTPVPVPDAVTLMNLPQPLPLNDFMTFAGIPALDFTLTSVGTGVTNTDCSAAGLAAHSGVCIVAAGDPIVLSQIGTDVQASLAVAGTASDGTSPGSTWSGAFSDTITPDQVPGFSGTSITPAQLQAYFLGGGSPFPTTYSGTFSAFVTSTPEPSSIAMTLIGSSLILLAISRRRKLS